MVFPTNNMGKYQISISGFGHGNLGPYYKPQPPMIFSGFGNVLGGCVALNTFCAKLSFWSNLFGGFIPGLTQPYMNYYTSRSSLSGGGGGAGTSTPTTTNTPTRSEDVILKEAKGLKALSHYSASNSAELKAQISADKTARQGLLDAAKDIDIVDEDNKNLTYQQLIDKVAKGNQTKKTALTQLFRKYTLTENIKAGDLEEAIECLSTKIYQDAQITKDDLLAPVENKEAVNTVKKAKEQYLAAAAAEEVAGTVDPKDVSKKMDALVTELAQARTGEKDINGKIKQLEAQSTDLQNKINKIKPGKKEAERAKLEEQKRQIDKQIQTLRNAITQAKTDIDKEQTNWAIPTIIKPGKPKEEENVTKLKDGYTLKDGVLSGPNGQPITEIRDEVLTNAGFKKTTKDNVWQYGSSYYLVQDGKLVQCEANGKVKKSGGAGGGDNPVYTPQKLTYDKMCADNYAKIQDMKIGDTKTLRIGVAGKKTAAGSKNVQVTLVGTTSSGNFAIFKDKDNNVYSTFIGEIKGYTYGFVRQEYSTKTVNGNTEVNSITVYGPNKTITGQTEIVEGKLKMKTTDAFGNAKGTEVAKAAGDTSAAKPAAKADAANNAQTNGNNNGGYVRTINLPGGVGTAKYIGDCNGRKLYMGPDGRLYNLIKDGTFGQNTVEYRVNNNEKLTIKNGDKVITYKVTNNGSIGYKVGNKSVRFEKNGKNLDRIEVTEKTSSTPKVYREFNNDDNQLLQACFYVDGDENKPIIYRYNEDTGKFELDKTYSTNKTSILREIPEVITKAQALSDKAPKLEDA